MAEDFSDTDDDQGTEVPVPTQAVLYRWVAENHLPKLPGRVKPNSDLFRPSTDGTGTSVVVVDSDAERTELLESKGDEFYWVSLTAKDVRALGLEVVWDLSQGPHHAAITNWPPGKNAAHRLRKVITEKTCKWEGRMPPLPPAE